MPRRDKDNANGDGAWQGDSDDSDVDDKAAASSTRRLTETMARTSVERSAATRWGKRRSDTVSTTVVSSVGSPTSLRNVVA